MPLLSYTYYDTCQENAMGIFPGKERAIRRSRHLLFLTAKKVLP